MAGQIKKGAIISYFSLFIYIIIGLCYTPWVIRSIGQEEYGLYSLALSIISLFVFDFGLSSSVSRFLSKFLAEGDHNKVSQFMGITVKLYILADFIVLAILSIIFILIPFIYKGLTFEEIEKFKFVFVISSVFSVLSFPFIPLNGILTAYEKFVPLKMCDLLNKILIVVLMSGCLLSGMGLYALVLVNACAGLLTIGVKLYIVKTKTDISINWFFWDSNTLKAILSFSFWVLIMSICQRLVMNICPSILGMLANTKAIAIFSVSIAIEGMFFSFANAINGLFLPRVSQMIAQGNEGQIQNLMVRVGRIQLFIIGLLFIGFIAVGQSFVSVWLGPEYSSVYVCVLLLIFPSFIHLPEEIASTAIVAKNEVKNQAYVSILKGVCNIILAFPLVYYWGVYGISFSIFVSYSVYVICMNILYKKKLGIDVKYFFKETFYKMGPFFIFEIFFLLGLFAIIDISSGWYGVVLKTLITLFSYLVIVGLGALNSEERKLALSILKK